MKFTIITPSYNQAEFINSAIKSVFNQKNNSFEIEHLIFDNQSSDGTISVLQKNSTKVSWVSAEDQGQADAVNKGLLLASGDIIGWLNSDDMYYPYAFFEVFKYFKENPNINIAYGKADVIDSNGSIVREYKTTEWNFNDLKKECYICQPALFFRSSIIDKYGLLDKSLKFCMDYEFWLRIGAHEEFGYISDVKIAGSRMHNKCKSFLFQEEIHKEVICMHLRKFGKVEVNWLISYAHTLSSKYFLVNKNSILYKIIFLLMACLISIKWKKNLFKYYAQKY